MNLGIQSGRYRYPPEGLFSGHDGLKAQFLVNGKPGNPYGLTQLKPGDVVLMDAGGGGGYGDPLKREPESVEADVLDGYVSVDGGRKHYGVVIDPKTMDLDMAATKKLRASLRNS